MAPSDSFFSYTDTKGVEVIVQRLADVPEQYRAQVKHIDLSKPAIPLPAGPGEAARPVPAASFHVPSFILGAGMAAVLGMVALVALRRARRMVALVVTAVVVAALGIGYLTVVRRQAGLPGAGLATPATLLDDARTAAEAMGERHREQERVLNELDKQR